MRIVVQDANIIIDLIECGVFELFFRLELEVLTTSIVLAEITEAAQKKACQAVIDQKALHVVKISTIEYLRLQSQNLPGLSVPDRSVLELAEAEEASLLTGDGKLRRTAKSSDIDVRGILWIFDQLVEGELLLPADAHVKLIELRQRNQRLPQRDIESRLRAWSR
jgi:predicted nucleic acid-binding protein